MQRGRAKIFANFARFYEAVPLDMVDRAFPGERQIVSSHVRSTAMGGCNPLDASTVEVGCASDANRLVINDAFSPNQLWTPNGGDKVPVAAGRAIHDTVSLRKGGAPAVGEGHGTTDMTVTSPHSSDPHKP